MTFNYIRLWFTVKRPGSRMLLSRKELVPVLDGRPYGKVICPGSGLQLRGPPGDDSTLLVNEPFYN